jgi:hypothetical protein
MHHAKTRPWCLGGLSLALLVIGLVLPSRVEAAGTCASPAGNYFDGAYAPDASSVQGARAVIDTRTTQICDPDDGFSSAWTMLTGQAATDGWAQQGFGHYRLGTIVGFYGFSQWTLCYPACILHTRYLTFPTTDENWRTAYWPSDTHLHMVRQNTNLDETSFNPFDVWTLPMMPQLFGETTRLESDVIGTANVKAPFTEIQKKKPNGTWVEIGTLEFRPPDSSRYHQSNIDMPHSFNIWTDPL